MTYDAASYWGCVIGNFGIRGINTIRQAAERCSAAFILDSDYLVQLSVAGNFTVRKNINDTLFDLCTRRLLFGHDV
jgi:hypothetical protein